MKSKLQNLIEFFSPAAFEARSRRREQLALRRELAEVDGMREWCDGREAFILGRLAMLGQQEAAATLREFRFVAAAQPQPWNCRSVPLPVTDEAHGAGAAG